MDQIINQFLSGEIVENLSRTYLKQSDLPSDKWSRMNKILMYLQGTKDARTWKAWNQVDRWLKPNARRFYIVAPVYVTKQEYDEEKKELKEYKVLVGFRPQEEVPIEDTYGSEIEYVEKPANLPTIQQIAEKFGLTAEAQRSVSGEWGSYIPSENKISLSSSDISTFLHELVHHGHKLVLKKQKKDLKGGQQLDQEIIAEFGSLVLVHILGFKTKESLKQNMGFTLKYIKGYIGTNDNEKVVREIKNLFGEITEVLDLILAEPILKKKEIKENIKVSDKVKKVPVKSK